MVEGKSRVKWDSSPATGVQVLLKKLDGEKSRVGWHNGDGLMESLSPTAGIYEDCHFYAYFKDGPAGVTPDAVLDLWHQQTDDSSVRLGDLSLDELASIGVKCGRSIPDREFSAILERAIHDPAIA